MTWIKVDKNSSNWNKVEPKENWFRTGWFKDGWFKGAKTRDTWTKIDKKEANWNKVTKE